MHYDINVPITHVMLTFVCVAFFAYSSSLLYKKKKELDKNRHKAQNLQILVSIGKSMSKNYENKGVKPNNDKYFRKHRTDMIILGSLIFSFFIYLIAFTIMYLT